jgi:hypothetical protein
MKLIVPFLLVLYTSISVQGQRPLTTSQLVDQAEEFEKAGKYGKAGDNYEAAWRDKEKKTDWLYLAAENYNRARDYQKASKAYGKLMTLKISDAFLGLKYARALKQNGQSREAVAAFQSFINNYDGDGKPVLEEIVALEIQGCQMNSTPNPGYIINYAVGDLNTSSNEFAPILLSNDLLYFTSTQGNLARIYRSVKQGGRWSKGVVPENFPVITTGQYGYGTLTPDGGRFYFSICEPSTYLTPGNTRCEIFVIQRRGALWTSPVRLPENINLPGKTATHPFVVHDGDSELLYFSSNRPGGKGLMDLWFTSRNLNVESMSFSEPVNLGSEINTLGDEIAPFYDPNEKKLYYSSNGKITLGGYDIFITEGQRDDWNTPINPSIPINSSADDTHFFKLKDQPLGFLSSNRKSDKEKSSTRDDDLFEISFKSTQIYLQASVYKLENTQPVENGVIKVFEGEGATRKIIFNEDFIGGNYKLPLEAGKKYTVELESEGLVGASYEFTTDIPDQLIYGKDRFLEKITKIEPQISKATSPPSPIPTKEEPKTPPTPVIRNEITTPTPSPIPTKEEPKTPPTPVIRNEITTPTPSPIPTKEEPKTPPTPVIRNEIGNSSLQPSGSSGEQKEVSYYNGRAIISNYRPGELYIARGSSRGDQLLYQSSSPRYQGIYFKIQLLALNEPNLSSSVFNQVRTLGNLETEYLMDRNISRVLLGDYFSHSDASGALVIAKNMGFKDAYLVRYEDGTRFGRVN